MAQSSLFKQLQYRASTVNNGAVAEMAGLDGYAAVEVVESNGGTATLTLQGSFDQTIWYSVGYEQIDATASPTRAVTGISVTASLKAVFQVLDKYPFLRAAVSSPSSSPVPKVTVNLYALPQ